MRRIQLSISKHATSYRLPAYQVYVIIYRFHNLQKMDRGVAGGKSQHEKVEVVIVTLLT